MSDATIQAQRQKLRNIASISNPAKPDVKHYRIGTETVACTCVTDGVAKPDCETCNGSGKTIQEHFVDIRKPSALVTSALLKVSGRKLILTELPQRDASGNPLRSMTVEGDQATFNAHATFLCTFVPDTNIRVWDSEADHNRMLAETADQLPQAEIGPIVDAMMQEVRKQEGKG